MEAQPEQTVLPPAAVEVEVPFYRDGSVVIVIGDVAGGKAILSAMDTYLAGLSDFEKAAKLQRASPPSLEEFMQHQADQVIPWDSADMPNITKVVETLRPRFARFANLALPARILLNLTTGEEEGGAAYCRGLNGVFLARPMVEWEETGDFTAVECLLTHELWHIISRNMQPAARDEVYGVINYQPLGHPLEYPPILKPLKISNPDAVLMEHCVLLPSPPGLANGILPILFSTSDEYEEGSGKTFFKYLIVAFTVVVKSNGQERWEFATAGRGVPVLFTQDQLPDEFWQAVGKNTSYLHHPEETVADNFMHLVMGHKADVALIPNPEILDRLGKLLGETERNEETASMPT